MCSDLEATFPLLHKEGYIITSPKTPTYNCIAWAAGEDFRWWWPDPNYQYYWPIRTRNCLIKTFKDAFATLGYISCCMNACYECGYEKVAIYRLGFNVTHMARQLPSGEWTSKCGQSEDIIHCTLAGLESSNPDGYGSIAEILKRPNQEAHL